MGERLAVTCDSCGESMVRNVSTLHENGCLWLCLNPGCPDLRADQLVTADLVEAGVPEALADRLARLIGHYVHEREAPARTIERAQADLAQLRGQLLELGRLAEASGAVAAHIDDSLSVWCTCSEHAAAQDAKQSLAVVAALCVTLRRIAADAQARLADVDPGLRGFMELGALP